MKPYTFSKQTQKELLKIKDIFILNPTWDFDEFELGDLWPIIWKEAVGWVGFVYHGIFENPNGVVTGSEGPEVFFW